MDARCLLERHAESECHCLRAPVERVLLRGDDGVHVGSGQWEACEPYVLIGSDITLPVLYVEIRAHVGFHPVVDLGVFGLDIFVQPAEFGCGVAVPVGVPRMSAAYNI